jgi:TonB family protein
MTHLFVLWLALFSAQAPTPATPSTQPPAAQPAQPASATTPNQAAPAEPPSPIPDASGIYLVGGGVTAPKIIYMPQPNFSELARKQKIGGIATVYFRVDEKGNTQNVHISRSIADMVDRTHRAAALSLDQAAVDAVKQYKFEPATLHGKPVPVYLNVQVNFQLF